MKKLKKLLLARYEDDEFMFKFTTGVKFVSISLGFMCIVLMFSYLLLKIDLIFFRSNGYPSASEFGDAFYTFISASLIDEIPYVILSIICIFFLGFYLSSKMIRPFKAIARYCEERLEDKENYYSPDYLSDLKLLTSFSVFFFSRIDEAKLQGKLLKVEVPQSFTRIHKPIFEKNFFFNYLFIIVIFALIASVGILVLNNSIREQISMLSQNLFAARARVPNGIRYFLEEQYSVADVAVYFFLMIHVMVYCLFGIHLYSKVSAPAFAIFATMRSFLKGNYHNRVHLIGHYYLRDDCRKINKYLDHIQKTLT